MTAKLNKRNGRKQKEGEKKLRHLNRQKTGKAKASHNKQNNIEVAVTKGQYWTDVQQLLVGASTGKCDTCSMLNDSSSRK
jgi:hypothetical protein